MKSIHGADKSLSDNLLVMNVMSDRAALICHTETIHKTVSMAWAVLLADNWVPGLGPFSQGVEVVEIGQSGG